MERPWYFVKISESNPNLINTALTSECNRKAIKSRSFSEPRPRVRGLVGEELEIRGFYIRYGSEKGTIGLRQLCLSSAGRPTRLRFPTEGAPSTLGFIGNF